MSRTAAGTRQLAADAAGDFRPLLRMYEPGEAVFDGRYELPPITKSP
jgi:hypothetical protein